MDDLGYLLLSRFSEGAVQVGIGDLALGDGDARVLVEDVDEGEEVGDEVVEDEEDGNGDDGDPESRAYEYRPHLVVTGAERKLAQEQDGNAMVW